MKKKESINHFTGREQQALLRLKNKIVKRYQPLIVYLIGCKSASSLIRNYLVNPRNIYHWSFSCDLLVVMPQGANIPENASEGLKSISDDYGHIHIIAHPIDFVVQQLKEYSIFFCWIQRRAVVLYEWQNACEKLPEAVQNMKQYEQQAHRFLVDNPNYDNYTEVKLSPLPQKNIQQEATIGPSQRPQLSLKLQNNMADFLRQHGARETNLRLRRRLLEYVASTTHLGIPNDFHSTLDDFNALTEFFDLAETEFLRDI